MLLAPGAPERDGIQGRGSSLDTWDFLSWCEFCLTCPQNPLSPLWEGLLANKSVDAMN